MKYAATCIIILLVLLKLYNMGLQQHHQPPPSTSEPEPEQTEDLPTADFVPSTWREQFAIDLLVRLGNDHPTTDIVAFVVEWTIAEDGGDGAALRNNPLNTTKCGFNNTGAINNDGACGVSGYATYEDGIDATVSTIEEPQYNDLLWGLQNNDYEAAFNGLIISPWAASHYNGGVGWPHVDVIVEMPNQQEFAQVSQQSGGKYMVTDDMNVSADFYATGSPAWAGQGGMHYGVDYSAPQGSPVYMPFDCSFVMWGRYDDPGRMGDYIICIFGDGIEYYSGHLDAYAQFQPGQIIPAGTMVGTTNVYNHTHIQLRDPSGNLLDFEDYFNTH